MMMTKMIQSPTSVEESNITDQNDSLQRSAKSIRHLTGFIIFRSSSQSVGKKSCLLASAIQPANRWTPSLPTLSQLS